MTSPLRSLVAIGTLVIAITSIATVAEAQAPATFITYAGRPATGSADGAHADARFSGPRGVAFDSNGDIYVSDSHNFTIRKITNSGVETFAGTAGSAGSADGTGSDARFRSPGGMAFDSFDNLYVADTDNHTIRMITPEGVVTTLAGTAGNEGNGDGTGQCAEFSFPEDVVFDNAGNLYVADAGNGTIRKIEIGTGAVTTFAGTAGMFGTVDATGAAARFNAPVGVAIDSAGNLFVTEPNLIRKITPGAAVTTFAGSPGQYGATDGTGSAARFSSPWGLSIDAADYLYVGDDGNALVRKISPDAEVTTLAGMEGKAGSQDGNGSGARFIAPKGLAVTPGGSLYVADEGTSSIRVIDSAGEVLTLTGAHDSFGSTNGFRNVARLGVPAYVALDAAGNLYVTEVGNQMIRKISSGGQVTILAGSPTNRGSADGTGSAAQFADPTGIVVDPATGNLYVSDGDNSTIRRITPAGVVTTFAGLADGGPGGFVDATGSAARFNDPVGIVIDSTGNLFVADSRNHVIRKITPGAVVTTFAGTGTMSGFADGTGSAARFLSPHGLAIDSADNLFVGDAGNRTIRKITPAGVVTTVAGTVGGSGTADGTGSAARFMAPTGLAVDALGNVYIADTGAHTIRMMTPSFEVTTIAGAPEWASSGDGTGSAPKFAQPHGIAVAASGALYVADSYNNTIRKSLTNAGGGANDYDGDGKADLVVYRPGTGTWYQLNSSSNFTTNSATQFGLNGDVPVPGDYDGDSKTDKAVFRPTESTWYVLQSTTDTAAIYPFGLKGDLPVPGDYDGDLKADPAVYRRSNGTWYVLTSSSNHLTTMSFQWGLSGDVPVPGDYDGDGTSDFAVFRPSTGTWYFVTSGSGSTVSRSVQWGLSGDVPVPGEYDGDGITDIAVYRPNSGEWFVLQSTSDFATSASFQWGLAGDVPVQDDYDDDGKTDLAVYRVSTGTWYISQSATSYTTSVSYQWGLSGDIPAPSGPIANAIAVRSTLATLVRAGDFDADHKADLTVYRPSEGTWYTLQSSTNYGSTTSVQWGLSGDIPVSHDYDGNSQTDAAVFRPSTGVWYATGGGTSASVQWGLSGDTPVPGDYDGDGISDPAFWRPSTGDWHILHSGTGYATSTTVQWGVSGDVPVAGDYDGDALTDPAVYRPSTGQWFIRHSSTGYTTWASFALGGGSDITVPGDYDGDGKTDVAVYASSKGEWSLLLSSTGYAGATSFQWGLDGDVPVPGDFDGDRKTDLAVWRPSIGTWYLLRSSSNFTVYDQVQWGLPGDIPILKRP